MILQCTFEELSVMSAAAERVLAAAGAGGVAAPAQIITDIEALAPRLTGDIGVESLPEVDAIQHAGVAAAWAMPHGKVQIGVDGVTRTSVGRAASKRGVEISYYEGGRPHVIQVGSENPERLAYIIERARKPALGR